MIENKVPISQISDDWQKNYVKFGFHYRGYSFLKTKCDNLAKNGDNLGVKQYYLGCK